EIYPGFTAAEYIVEDGAIKGIVTGDMGVDANGEPKAEYSPGMELRAKYTVFAEGCRGHLGKRRISEFKLDEGKDPQHYGSGIKELWDIDPANHKEGLVLHGAGWPLSESGSSGGFLLYHAENNHGVVRLSTGLSYSNPPVCPFDEYQRMQHHPVAKPYRERCSRASYGARSIPTGRLHCLPNRTFPGGLPVRRDAGPLHFAEIKGTHTA